jgi:hypothetical protein
MSNLYAADGFCHNANYGTYGHECGKPASWIGVTPKGFRSGFCSHCKQNGDEARQCTSWEPVKPTFTDTCLETAYGTTTRLSFQIRVF